MQELNNSRLSPGQSKGQVPANRRHSEVHSFECTSFFKKQEKLPNQMPVHS